MSEYRWVVAEDGWMFPSLHLEDRRRNVYAVVRPRHDGGPWHVTFPEYDPTPFPDADAACARAMEMADIDAGEVGT